MHFSPNFTQNLKSLPAILNYVGVENQKPGLKPRVWMGGLEGVKPSKRVPQTRVLSLPHSHHENNLGPSAPLGVARDRVFIF